MNKAQGHRSQKHKGYYSDFATRLKHKKDARERDRKKRIANSTPTTYAQHRLIRSLENHRSGVRRGDRIPGERTPTYFARVARRKYMRIKRRNESAMDKSDRL